MILLRDRVIHFTQCFFYIGISIVECHHLDLLRRNGRLIEWAAVNKEFKTQTGPFARVLAPLLQLS